MNQTTSSAHSVAPRITRFVALLCAMLAFAVPGRAQRGPLVTIHSFAVAPFGASPRSSLIQASDGNLYGTTSAGGSGRCSPDDVEIGCGTVFKISKPATSPTETVVYSFAGGSDGASPRAALIQASDGNLYGTTSDGGSGGWGTIFKISDLETFPTESVIYNFTGGADGGNPQAALIQASDGNLYGTTSSAGPGNGGAIFKISNPTTSPSFSVVFSGTKLADPLSFQAPLIQASDGDLYGTSGEGGLGTNCFGGCGTVFKISDFANSPKVSVIYKFTGGADGAYPAASLIQASDGSLYGTASGIEEGLPFDNGAIFKISNLKTSPTFSVIYSFSGGTDGSGPQASLIQTFDGDLYGTSSGIVFNGANGDGTIFKISNLSSSPTFSAIYGFTGGADGSDALASVVQVSDGDLYGTTFNGGPSEDGTVFRISNVTTFPTESVIYAFEDNGSDPEASLVEASDGNLYGTTSGGGSRGYCPAGCGTIFKISDIRTSPAESLVYRFEGGTAGDTPLASLIEASDGNLYGTTFGSGRGAQCYDDCGTVFKISELTTPPTESVLHTFTGSGDGSGPAGSLIQTAGGSLYGTTVGSGSYNAGTVFTISNPATSPAESVIYDFTGGPIHGGWPAANLIQASDGNIYGTMADGELGGEGGVFRINDPATSPTETVIYRFIGGVDGANSTASLILASDGSYYGTTLEGGSSTNCQYGCGTVFRISNLTSVPTETVIYRFNGGIDGNFPQASLIQASDGNLYGTTSGGGGSTSCQDGCGTIFEIANPTTSPAESVIYRFTGAADGANPRAALIQASDFNLYGTTSGGGSGGAGTVFKLSLFPLAGVILTNPAPGRPMGVTGR